MAFCSISRTLNKFPPALVYGKQWDASSHQGQGYPLLDYLLQKCQYIFIGFFTDPPGQSHSLLLLAQPPTGAHRRAVFLLSLFPANTAHNKLWLVCSCTLLASACFVLWQCKLWHEWLFQPSLNRVYSTWRRVQLINVNLVWGYPHTFVKTFHKPSQLEVGLTLSSSRGGVLCHGQCKQSLTSAEVSWANLGATKFVGWIH